MFLGMVSWQGGPLARDLLVEVCCRRWASAPPRNSKNVTGKQGGTYTQPLPLRSGGSRRAWVWLGQDLSRLSIAYPWTHRTSFFISGMGNWVGRCASM